MPRSSPKSTFQFYYSPWNFNFISFSGDSKQKFVLFLIHQEREVRKKNKTESRSFTYMADNGLPYRITSVHHAP